MSKIGKVIEKAKQPSLLILRYHSILENPDSFAAAIGRGIIHSADMFEAHMKIIATEFNNITIDDVCKFLNGEKLPRRSVAITFDDGFADNADVAAPIMNSLNLKGTFYVTTGSIEGTFAPWFIRLRHAFATTDIKYWNIPDGKQRLCLCIPREKYEAFISVSSRCAKLCGQEQDSFIARIEKELETNSPEKDGGFIMSRSQIVQLDACGHMVGSHTVSHPNLAHISDKEAFDEIHHSKIHLETILKKNVKHFAYPSPILQPHWNRSTVENTRNVGYSSAVTCTPGIIRVGDCPLSLKRIAIPEDEIDFKWSIETAFCRPY